MIIATVKQPTPIAFLSQDGASVQVGAGEITGSYYATAHGDEAKPKANRQHLSFSFATADDRGEVFVHLSLLTIRTLWPADGTVLEFDPTYFDFCEASMRNVEIDGGSLPPLSVERPDGLIERRFIGPIRVGFECRRKKWGLDARLSIHSGDPYDLNLAYKVPLERLLWKPYALFTDDDVIGEAADHVFFKWIRKLSKYDEADGLRPGPIHVVSAGRPIPD